MSFLFRTARRVIDVRREQQIRAMLARFMPVRHRSSATNIYHCCVWKTASQWIRNIFSTTDVYRYSGMLPYTYDKHEGTDDRSLQDRTFDHAFPTQRIITPLYTNYSSFAGLPKPDNYRCFFVTRDPRDLVVSHYFSSKYSHVENPGVLEERARLDGLSDRDGMQVHMEYMAERGIFKALHEWAQAAQQNPEIRLFMFEDLTGKNQLESVGDLMAHCDIALPEENLKHILDHLSFKKLSGGRKQGDENKFHKYRSGKPGDWQKYFDDELQQRFREVTNDCATVLGYQ